MSSAENDEVRDPLAPGVVWDYGARMANPAAFRSHAAGADGVRALFDANAAAFTVVARRIHALLTGTEPDDD